MHLIAGMGRTAKRTRITGKKTSASSITIRHKADSKGYVFYLVQGWQENGKWQRKQFKEEKDAQRFAALKRVEMENQGRAQRMILSPLSDEQNSQAVQAFDALGETYTLAEAVSFFLKHHRPPEFTIRMRDAIALYLDEKERDGRRKRTVKSIAWTLRLFNTATDNPFMNEVTQQQVEAFLRGLRAKNGTDKAKRRTWEIHRGALHGFFAWSSTADPSTSRPFCFSNPAEGVRKFTARQVREQQASKVVTTNPKDALRIFSFLMRWREGRLVCPYALLYFAGLRPIEVERLKGRERELINLKTRTITIPAAVSKTIYDRQVHISDNLAAWLRAYPMKAIPVNYSDLNKRVRKHFKLSPDEQRHSFISYHVALHRSIGDASLQAGNSENIVKRYYLNTHTREEGDEFFRIVPAKNRAILRPAETSPAPTHLRAI